MINNLPTNAIHAVHLRAPSSSGGKDWVGSVTSTGEIHTYWGRTGTINQHASKRGNISELHQIVSSKKSGRDQYVMVDEFDMQHGWHSQKTHAADPSVTKQKKPEQLLTPVFYLVQVILLLPGQLKGHCLQFGNPGNRRC